MPAERHLLFPAARPAEAIRTGWKSKQKSRVFLIFVVNPRFILSVQSKPCERK